MSSQLSLRVSFHAKTEEEESRNPHFVGTTCGLPSNASSATDLLDFEAAVDVSSRCRLFLMRSSKLRSPSSAMRTSLHLPWSIQRLGSKQMVLVESMSKGSLFVSMPRDFLSKVPRCNA